MRKQFDILVLWPDYPARTALKKATLLFGFLLVLGAAVLFGLRVRQTLEQQSQSTKKGKKDGAARIVNVNVSQARPGQVRQEILLTGALRPKEQVDITAKSTGRVEGLTYQLGDFVQKGAVIAVLEADELKQQVSRARAALSVVNAATKQRMAELENSKANFARSERLVKEGLLPRSDYESSRTAYEVVQAQLELSRAQEGQARAEIRELEIRLEQTRILAPMDGYVSKRHVDHGALVNPSMPILTLVNLSTMVTMAAVPEQEVGKLRIGTRARVEVDAFGEQSFEGRVARIAPVLDAATRSATVEVEIPNPGGRLKAEMFARVTLDLGAMRPALLIPRDGLVYRGSQPGVFMVDRGRSTFKPIETGQTLGNEVEVLANLQPGAQIVTRGSAMLREGDQLRIVNAESRGAQEPERGKE
ncbi:MAG: efflux RND transporter periplasmic adaptor subunit [Acidobacteria bacterium]|nr:efflux RND transporter periplasmic adaptor subunit [Acidobacteriota bacterium]